jgi:hypothetical protein
MDIRVAQASAMSATVAGVLVTTVAALQGLGGVAPSSSSGRWVELSSTDSGFEESVSQILDIMEQKTEEFSQLDFATSHASEYLPTVLQNMNYEILGILLSNGTSASDHGISFVTPELVAGDSVDPRAFMGFFNADTFYPVVEDLDPDATYQMSGTVGDGTGDFVVTLNEGSANSEGNTSEPLDFLQLDHSLQTDSDGNYTITIGPDNPGGDDNFIDTSDTEAPGLITRDRLSDMAAGPGKLEFSCIENCPESDPGVTSTGLSDENIDSLVNLVSQQAAGFYDFHITEQAEPGGILENPNTMTDFDYEGVQGGFPGQAMSLGNFHLGSDEALIVKVPEIDSGYNSIQLNDVFGTTLPGTLSQTTLNESQAFHSSDGYNYFVVSGENPGVANWLDTGGAPSGEIMARSENFGEGVDPIGESVSTEVVPVDEVKEHLPDDTPNVSPEEFAATMNERVLSYNYSLDTWQANANDGQTWVTSHLWLDDIQNAMGSKDFDAAFGEEPAMSMLLRLTPALSPDMGTVIENFLANPSDSWDALEDNLSLAGKDLEMPIQLMEERFEKDFLDLSDSLQDAMSSDDPLQDALQALGDGADRFGTTLSDALFDPNTSITAGILNARDDLAVAVSAANDNGFPSEGGPLATWEWDHMSDLMQITPDTVLQDVGSMFTADDSSFDTASSASTLDGFAADFSEFLQP